MGYNLTEKQREILRWVVAKVQEKAVCMRNSTSPGTAAAIH